MDDFIKANLSDLVQAVENLNETLDNWLGNIDQKLDDINSKMN